ncbi:glucose-1-phosphate cytidylyltransferase [Terrarubrum flagellatum]|uniref:glucose-1-phosphate cytidylyltransferase n=1 Tax=Terrirubrum flagellatum TaxID=2895980 RepID=UPI003145674C
MKAVILAGGLGTRLAEETEIKPKPMVEIGGRPIIWHIMKIYSHFGINDFIVCLGYKGYVIKEYFQNYRLHRSNVTIDLAKDVITTHESNVEPWKITLVETGANTMTGGRIQRIRDYVGDSDFCLTYGDGVAKVDIAKLIETHKAHGKAATVTAVQPPGRFGSMDLQGDKVRSFMEKPKGDGGWINGGFFVLKPKIFDYLSGDGTVWEQEPLRRLAADGELVAFQHTDFWQAMDTLREKQHLENLWSGGSPPWRVWS